MCIITATELKENLKKYIELSAIEDVLVTKNGKVVTMLTSTGLRESAVDAFLSLAGKYNYVDYQALLDEREAKR